MDRREEKLPLVKGRQICFVVIGLLFLIGDQIFDIVISVIFWKGGHTVLFGISVILNAGPLVVISAVSSIMYQIRARIDVNSSKKKFINNKCRWRCWYMNLCCTVFSVIFCFNFFWRFGEFTRKSCKIRRLQHNETPEDSGKENNKQEQLEILSKFYADGRDVFFLRLLEAYLECGPQLVLRLYMFFKHIPQNTSVPVEVMYVAMIFSVLSMAWASANYQRWRLYCIKDANFMSMKHTIACFFCEMFIVACRVYFLAVFLSLNEYVSGVCAILHLLFAVVWIMAENGRSGREDVIENMLFSLVTGFVYLFTFIDASESPTLWQKKEQNGDKSTARNCFIYYIVIFIENSLIFSICIIYNTNNSLIELNIAAALLITSCIAIIISIMRKMVCPKPKIHMNNDCESGSPTLKIHVI